MDNQIFPTGTYLDDMPQVCTLCGVMLNNARSLYNHMQYHILSSNLGGQPPDAGLGLNPANILDLLTGVSQHGVPNSVPAPILPPQTLFTPVSSVPTRLITPTALDLGLASLQSVPIPHLPVKTKEKKVSHSKQQAQNSSSQASSSSRTSGSGAPFVPSFSKESKKVEEPVISHSKTERSSVKEPFQISSKFESVEDTLGLAPVTKSSLDRKSSTVSKAVHEPNHSKDVKLFQPFVTNETSSSLSFLPKSSHFHTSSGLISPPAPHPRSPDKSKEMDILNTPQKVNTLSTDLRTDDLNLTSESLAQATLGEERKLNKGKSQEMLDSLFDKMKETPAPPPKTSTNQPDSHILKTQFFPSILDPLNISPKSTQVFPRDNVSDIDTFPKITPQAASFTSKPTTSYEGDNAIISSGQTETAPMISPKVDTAIEMTGKSDPVNNSSVFEPRDNTDASQPIIPPTLFGSAATTSGIPPVAIAPLRSTSPPVLGHTDPTKNPLGTGFFNALTQKLINPGLSICTDFTKTPTSSTVNVGGDTCSKGYYENGVLLNHDYDKISDTNDEDDLERLIDIDPKEDTNIDSKSIEIIDDILNEFNERTEDVNKGNRNQLYDICNVLDDGLKGKSDGKADALVDENIKTNISIIDELLEKEKEKIDLEMRESARMQATSSVSVSTNVVTCTSSILTFSSSTTSSTTSNTGLSSGIFSTSSTIDQSTDKKKEDDNIDFEIPRVGKLMKIRKYFESQEQKKKEQTQIAVKDTEIKVQEKKEPVAEEKPQLQTILVQVSKRKKIEYGPYINRQSLLEGKPKEADPASPSKIFRPKPRPQVPVRRSFNLRARKTKTDFASLANKGSRSFDGKKGLEKVKSDKSANSKEASDSSGKDEKDGHTDKDIKDSGDSKIVTRNKAAKVEVGKSSTVPVKPFSDINKRAKLEKDTKGDANKPSLRTRSNKESSDLEKQEIEGKSLRRRVVKSSPEDGKSAKPSKSHETSSTTERDDSNARKSLRSKIKTTPEKNDIKKCSVNLGENLSGSKLKAVALSTLEAKEKQKNQNDTCVKKLDNDICDANETSKTTKMKSDNDKVTETKTEIGQNDQNSEADKTDEIDFIKTEVDNNGVKHESTIEHGSSMKSLDDTKVSQTQANIFDVMSMDIGESKDKVKDENKPEKKVQVIKLKLGSEVQKSLKEIKESLSLSKKKKFEIHKDELQRELDTCTKKVTELQRQIAFHKEAENLRRQESAYINGDKKSRLDDAESDGFGGDTTKKVKHSVENEFQRLVNEAVEEVKKAEKSDSGKQERYVNLRKRLNETIKYNVDISDEEIETSALSVLDFGLSTPKSRKLGLKSTKITPPKFTSKFQTFGDFQRSLSMNKPVKKDVDVYDFTDTEMSDKEESTPVKLSAFKPKYVSNVGSASSKFLTKSSKLHSEGMENYRFTSSQGNMGETVGDGSSDEVSYIGKTVEPLKIKLTKIIPYKEKKHKHKKKRRKKDRERRKHESLVDDNDADDDEDDDESRDSVDLGNFDDKDSDSVEGVEEQMDSVGASIQSSKKSKLKTKNHICSFCNQAFSQKCDLRKHEMIHTGERPWPCEICDKKFLRKTDLAKHIRTHTGEKPYKCEFCDKRVSDKSQLNVHRRLHTGDRPYQCTQCGKGCITSSELTRHRSVHCTEKSHTCELCKKVFKVKENLGMHMKLHYKSRGKPFKCEKCALGFDQQQDFNSHNCANLQPTLFICSECYMEFMDEMLYAEHIKTHGLDVFSCNICTHIFEDKHSLETHLCTMGMEKKRQLHCQYCEKVFTDQGSLDKHLPEHDDDVGSFMCENCPQIFTVRKDFIAHSQKHRIEAFICNHCGTGFHDSIKAEMHRLKCPSDRLETNMSSQLSFVDQFLDKNQRASTSSRASVISANTNFKGMDSGPHSNMADGFYPATVSSNVNVGLQNVYSKSENPPVSNKMNIIDNDKIFEPSEFCNSPDFSSLTDDGNLGLELASFHKGKSNLSDKTSVQNQIPMVEDQKITTGNLSGLDLLSQQEVDSRKGKQFQNITSNLHGSQNSAHSDENRWIGSYQMSANDYVNSLLNKMDDVSVSSSSGIPVSNKRSSVKTENNQFTDLSKFQTTNRMEYKDNIESQSKSDIFSDFDFPVSNQKVPDLFQSASKSGIVGGVSSQDRVEFQDTSVNRTSFLPSEGQNYQEKSDFSSFSNSFLGFPQSSSYSLTGSLFGSSGQNTHKQTGSDSLFTGSQDLMHSNFFLSTEESMKGTLPMDKSDDTAALLSSFDYDLS